MKGSIAIALIVIWLIGLATSYTLGGLIHVLAIAAVIIWDTRLLQDSSL